MTYTANRHSGCCRGNVCKLPYRVSDKACQRKAAATFPLSGKKLALGVAALLIANTTDYSFPSGHTLSSVISAVILAKTDRRFGYAAIPLAALIAFSRLYLYVHFPSDVLAAAVLGIIIGLLMCRFGDSLLDRLKALRLCAKS